MRSYKSTDQSAHVDQNIEDNNYARSRDYCTYRIGEQRRLTKHVSIKVLMHIKAPIKFYTSRLAEQARLGV